MFRPLYNLDMIKFLKYYERAHYKTIHMLGWHCNMGPDIYC